MANPPKSWVLGSLIEHESCISLKHSRCWDPSSELKSAREQGVGLGQITRAYNAAGGLRFDALQELKDKHPLELKELTWSNVKTRPDLQIAAIVLKSRDNYDYFKKYTKEPLYFGDAGYNGGNGGVDTDRRVCKLTKGCDPNLWFGHVEKTCAKSKTPLYGNRSACDINRHHVKDVMQIRAKKYQVYFNF